MAARVEKAIHERKFGRQGAIYSLTLAAVVLAIYFQVWHFEFTGYDDPEFILNNPHIRNGLTPASIGWAFTTGYAANWFPLTWLSYMLGVDLYGLSPGWHHLTNVFLHALNSMLLFVVLRRLTGLPLADARGSEAMSSTERSESLAANRSVTVAAPIGATGCEGGLSTVLRAATVREQLSLALWSRSSSPSTRCMWKPSRGSRNGANF